MGWYKKQMVLILKHNMEIRVNLYRLNIKIIVDIVLFCDKYIYKLI